MRYDFKRRFENGDLPGQQNRLGKIESGVVNVIIAVGIVEANVLVFVIVLGAQR